MKLLVYVGLAIVGYYVVWPMISGHATAKAGGGLFSGAQLNSQGQVVGVGYATADGAAGSSDFNTQTVPAQDSGVGVGATSAPTTVSSFLCARLNIGCP